MLKTILYLSHRWLGIGMSLLVAMWFATGMVMMYVGFPYLTQQERYAGLPILEPERIKVSPLALLAKGPDSAFIEHLLLTSAGQRPVYLLKREAEPWRGLYADTGELLQGVTGEAAVATALQFFQLVKPEQVLGRVHQESVEIDQWTVPNRFSVHRPLHKVSINDLAGTELYVSSKTGQVVQDTTRKERIWNWVGANLHWIYPFQLRKHLDIWVQVIIALSLLGLFTVLTGAIIGFQRLCLRRSNPGESISPYRRGVIKYHHLGGLFALVFLTTFLFSGLMSMGPWGIFDSHVSLTEQLKRYQLGKDLQRSEINYAQVAEIQLLLKEDENVATREIVWRWLGGESYVTLHQSEKHQGYQLASTEQQSLEQKINQNIKHLIPGEKILSQERLEDYDRYYYSHHERLRPLPILRVKFLDKYTSWFYIDPSTGEVKRRMDSKARLGRWLFNGLHSMDFAVLINNRPVWDLLILSLCSAGLLFSVTSLVLAWRHLGKFIRASMSSRN